MLVAPLPAVVGDPETMHFLLLHYNSYFAKHFEILIYRSWCKAVSRLAVTVGWTTEEAFDSR